MNKTVVVDTSAIASLLVDGAAVDLPLDRAWKAPSLIDVEFSNVLWKRVAFSGTSKEKAEEFVVGLR